MVRTQLLPEPWQHRFLAALARRRQTSLSGLIRSWVDEKAARAPKEREDALFGMAGMVADREPDVSEKHDLYLYGKKGRRRP